MNQPVITRSAAEALQLGRNGSYSNEGNVLQHVVYDNMDFQNTTLRAETTFFSVPIGGNYMGGMKTLSETNLRETGKLPNGQTFLIKEFSMALIPTIVGADTDVNTILAAYYNITQASVYEIKLASREFDFQTPGSCLLNPVQVSAIMSAANGTATPGGEYISTGWLKLNSTPIPIGQLVSFNVIKKSGSAVAANATILDTASDVLDTQEAQEQTRLRGILTRAI
jgi:hypothetical protein